MSGIQPIFLITFIVVPIVLLLIFALAKPKRLPVAALIGLVLNLLVFGRELLYEDSRILVLSLILVQAAAVLVLAMALQRLIQQLWPNR